MKLFSKLSMLLVVAAMVISCKAPVEKALPQMIKTDVPERPAGHTDMIQFAAEPIPTVRVGFVGLGMRGPGAVQRFTHIPGVEIVALCDLRPERVENAQEILRKAGLPDATGYSGDVNSYKELCERDDIDLVYVATDWNSHAEVAVYAMESGKHVAIEVPAAISLEQIWKLIDTSERTRKHCMQLENCVYDFFELTTLNMAQQGLFGEIIHTEGSYIHDLSIYWDSYWNNWRLDFNENHRGDVYPTHGIGPVAQLLNIHRGDKMNYLVAVDTKPVVGPEKVKALQGREAPNFRSGDHTLTLIKTEKGKTMHIQHNVMTPRPYSRMYQLTGTKGFANKYPMEGYSLEPEQVSGDTEINIENLNAHRFVPQEVKAALMEKYKHPIHKELEEKAKTVGGHGGMDFIMDYRMIYCLQNGLPLDMDVYDLAEWCSLIPLTEISLDNGSVPVEVPDFTRGNWNKVDGLKFAY